MVATQKPQVSYDDTSELKKLFELFDADNSGMLCLNEVKTLLNSMGFLPTDKWLKKTLEYFDSDGNNKIDFDEFLSMFKCQKQEFDNNPERALKNALT